MIKTLIYFISSILFLTRILKVRLHHLIYRLTFLLGCLQFFYLWKFIIRHGLHNILSVLLLSNNHGLFLLHDFPQLKLNLACELLRIIYNFLCFFFFSISALLHFYFVQEFPELLIWPLVINLWALTLPTLTPRAAVEGLLKQFIQFTASLKCFGAEGWVEFGDVAALLGVKCSETIHIVFKLG